MSHYFCEANECADASARKGPTLDQDIIYFDSPSVDLYLLLFYNNMGLYYERRSHRILLLLILFVNAILIYQPKKKTYKPC